ncbi:MAG: response regulator transcription factor [Candidatus Schekmanbacteria bacterium]|nr:response regulator transcription factor [Candidatus Schekmanbacteria bacterium]
MDTTRTAAPRISARTEDSEAAPRRIRCHWPRPCGWSSFLARWPRDGEAGGCTEGAAVSAPGDGARSRVLIVEDDVQIRRLVALNLVKDGLCVREVGDGEAALALLAQECFDLVVLDITLPGLDGFGVCRELRARANTPILMLTARDDETDKVLGLELGADDYVTKPFGVRELRARVRALLRRAAAALPGALRVPPGAAAAPPTAPLSKPSARAQSAANLEGEEIAIGELILRAGEFLALRRGRQLDLSPTEFKLLLHFARNPRRVFSREELLAAVWGDAFEGYERTVDACITRLRRKIEDDPARPQWIRTVWGVGYQLRPPGAA